MVDVNTMAISQSIPEAYREAFTHNGKLFGLTQGAAFSVLYLNMQILEEAGWTEAPTNWDEFIQCCADIQEKTDVAPLTLAGDKTTTCWMLFELIIANIVGDQLGLGVYEEQFKAGTFDFTAYPEIAEHLAQVAPYMLTGTGSMTEDDVTAAMTDGTAAMCIAGNWTSNNICSGIEECTGDAKYVNAVLAPFNAAGAPVWISVSPETAFGLSNAPEENPAVVEAREIFFNWIFQPENFKMIQNARGTVPVLSTMTEDQIVLPAAIAAIVPAMGAAPFVSMGFNLWTAEFKDAACTALKDVYGGNKDAATAVAEMTELLKQYNRGE
jgi:ABC-type glycerol-3-phosphate transport system substrate-binding protein